MNLRFLPLLLLLFVSPVSGMKPVISGVMPTINVTATVTSDITSYPHSIFIYQAQFVPNAPPESFLPFPFIFLSAAAVLLTACLIQRGVASSVSRRDVIYEFILHNSGCQESTIISELGYSRGSVTHHLHKLEQTNWIISAPYHGTPRYYPKSAEPLARAKLAAVLSRKRPADIYRLIAENPGITQKEIANLSGLSEQTVRWHVKRLAADGVVQCTVEGKVKRYRIL